MTVSCDSATYVWVSKTAVKLPIVMQTVNDSRETCLRAKPSGMYVIIKFIAWL